MTDRPRAPKTEDYSRVPGSPGPRSDFRISVGLREGWDAEGRVFDVSEAVRTARAWMKRRVEAGQPALYGMFTRAEVTYAWPPPGWHGRFGPRTGGALYRRSGSRLSRPSARRGHRGDVERALGRARCRARAGADLCGVRGPDLDTGCRRTPERGCNLIRRKAASSARSRLARRYDRWYKRQRQRARLV